ncbi:hypothetical protein BJX65DRAFT_308898 [Aspergillus insuetus]
MAPRPELYPLKTPSQMAFPSELQEYLRATSNPEPTRRTDAKGPSVPPPIAYTEFLKALSPAYGSPPLSATAAYSSASFSKQAPSPISIPSTASTSSFPGDMAYTRPYGRHIPHSPQGVPRSAGDAGPIRRIRMSPTYHYSPGFVESPKSAHPSARSPYPPIERKVRYVESPTTTGERSITIQHVITHTVTYKRVPSLAAPPKGKRRRVDQPKSEKLR